jgi:hypothetical protein
MMGICTSISTRSNWSRRNELDRFEAVVCHGDGVPSLPEQRDREHLIDLVVLDQENAHRPRLPLLRAGLLGSRRLRVGP